MLPKRPSLQSLFTPSFVQPCSASPTDQPPPSSFPPRVHSLSPVTRKESSHSQPFPAIPTPSLLDDVPFATLISVLAGSPTSLEYPTLSEVPRPSTVVVSPRVYIPRATLVRPRSSGHGQARPAHTKPAFASRPSLPSLYTLAQMNVTIPRKVLVLNSA
ncbi:hypothetical protein PAXRUDRAFT_478496 [Paxillus rubicundulus Ve08.2h10]|uniref:Unplaced genomic scaffold scaffold_311, whole genome shotgun sequence n=1 Tax=Paxillus rubicundulus Ve08.2h10 TaxID=930991 RepID=A0A0D0E1C5_9AGAM|nr:hypothetical protein PAXRUDRAFT_478496 [Paxillus rubicundulus Ve08.2h10]